MTKRKKETLKKITEKQFQKKVIAIYNLDQGSTGETYKSLLPWGDVFIEYELLHIYKKRDVIIRNYKIINQLTTC